MQKAHKYLEQSVLRENLDGPFRQERRGGWPFSIGGAILPVCTLSFWIAAVRHQEFPSLCNATWASAFGTPINVLSFIHAPIVTYHSSVATLCILGHLLACELLRLFGTSNVFVLDHISRSPPHFLCAPLFHAATFVYLWQPAVANAAHQVARCLFTKVCLVLTVPLCVG